MIDSIINKVKIIADSWGESLEPPAGESELKDFVDRVFLLYSVRLPEQYVGFLQKVNGLEFNGFIIYGTKNSERDHDASPLDFFEMNEILQDSLRARLLDVVVVGEDSTGILTFDKSTRQFQYRDRIGLDRVEPFSSFEEMLRAEVEKVA